MINALERKLKVSQDEVMMLKDQILELRTDAENHKSSRSIRPGAGFSTRSTPAGMSRRSPTQYVSYLSKSNVDTHIVLGDGDPSLGHVFNVTWESKVIDITRTVSHFATCTVMIL